MKLVKVASMNEAIAIHDSAAEFGFYSSFENVRKEHETFFAKHPKMAAQWFVDADTNKIYHLSIVGAQRIINEHTLHSCISAGSINVVVMREDGTLEKIGSVAKESKKERELLCEFDENVYLTSVAA